MAPQEAVDRPPGHPETVVNRSAGQIASPLVQTIAQAGSGFLGGDLRGGSGANPLLLSSDVPGRGAVERLLREAVGPCRDKSGGEADRNIDEKRCHPAAHRWAAGLSEADVLHAGVCRPETASAQPCPQG